MFWHTLSNHAFYTPHTYNSVIDVCENLILYIRLRLNTIQLSIIKTCPTSFPNFSSCSASCQVIISAIKLCHKRFKLIIIKYCLHIVFLGHTTFPLFVIDCKLKVNMKNNAWFDLKNYILNIFKWSCQNAKLFQWLKLTFEIVNSVFT